MNYNVSWTEESKTTFNENLEYLSQKWDLPTINSFLDRVDEIVGAISQNPNLYPVYRKSGQVRKCVVNKHITLFYRIVGTAKVDLVTFWNTHQNPENLEL